MLLDIDKMPRHRAQFDTKGNFPLAELNAMQLHQLPQPKLYCHTVPFKLNALQTLIMGPNCEMFWEFFWHWFETFLTITVLCYRFIFSNHRCI